jgi:zinc protease
MQLALYDLPDDYFERFVPAVEAVTSDDVARVMTRYVDPTRLTTVVVGDQEAIGGDLSRLGFGDPAVLSPETL